MRLRYGKPILLLGFLASLYLEVSARFGGTKSSSGRSSGSEHITPLFIVIGLGGVGLYLLYYSGIIRLKKEEAATVINNADDPLWTEESLQTTARNTFMAMQQAWTNRSMEEVLPLISQHLYDTYIGQLEQMKASNRINVMNNIIIDAIEIIACTDDHENSKDSFAALIKGHMQDYIIDEISRDVVAGSTTSHNSFTDLYTFARYENQWLLHEIVQEPGTTRLLSLKSILPAE